MQRRLCSAILLLEAVVLGLSTPVMISVESIDKSQALWTGLGLTLACLLLSGMLRRPWAYGVGWAIQVAAIALGFLVTAMFVLGAIFLLLWLAAVRIGRLIDTDRAAAQAADAAGSAEAH
ncbi:MAG: DUF4233 domain-containing protein [Marmoricola sp.]